MTNRWDITRAVRLSDLPAPSRLVMLVLADVAEVGTGEIPERFTPSLNVLARETGLDKSTVVRHLDSLEAAGWVIRTKPTPEAARLRGERTKYRLTVPAGRTEQPDLGAERVTLGAEDDSPSRTERQDLVAENDKPSRTVRQRRTDLLPTDRSSSDLRSDRARGKRGTRIPDDFAVSPEMVAWARTNTPNVGAVETDAFVDWAHSNSTATAVKRDWVAAWRNWMRRSQKDFDGRREKLNGSTPSAAVKVPTAEQCPEHPGRRREGCGLCRAAKLGAKPLDHEGSAA